MYTLSSMDLILYCNFLRSGTNTMLALLLVTCVAAIQCNPWLDHSCSAVNRALGLTFVALFSYPTSEFVNKHNCSEITYSNEGATLQISKRGDSPHISSQFYILYGKVGIDIRQAPGQGIVSAFYLLSDDQDEIDIEMKGGNVGNVESNFFVKGNTTEYTRGMSHKVVPDLGFHRYEIEWTKEYVRWYIDHDLRRELTNDSEHGFPSSPMNIHFSLWAGGDSELDFWTVMWAGGITNYNDLPFKMTVSNLIVKDYSRAKTYTYGYFGGQWTPATSNLQVAAKPTTAHSAKNNTLLNLFPKHQSHSRTITYTPTKAPKHKLTSSGSKISPWSWFLS